MGAPCVPLIVHKNFFTWAIKACHWNLCPKILKQGWWPEHSFYVVPREGLLRCCNAQPRWWRWSVRRRYMSRPLQQEDESRKMFVTGCLCQLRTISSEPHELSLPDRNGIWHSGISGANFNLANLVQTLILVEKSQNSKANQKNTAMIRHISFEAHISASHLRNERAGYDDSGAQHNDEVLES